MLVALCLLYGAALLGVGFFAATGTVTADLVTGPVMVVFGVVALAYGVRAARGPGRDGPIRPALRVLVAAFACALATPLIFLATGPLPFPAPGDGAHMAFALLLFVALQLLPLHAATRRERGKAVLESGTVVVGASMVLWFFVVGPALDDGQQSFRLVLAAACYPVVDLLALFGFARAMLRGTGHVSRRALGLLGGASYFFFIGDAYLGYTQAHTTAVERTPWQFACWLTMHFLLACGALELFRTAGRPGAAADVHGRRVAGKLPYLGVGVGYALMMTAAVQESDAFPWLGLVLGGMGITGLVVARQLLAQNESTEAAETDILTGLANRARLHAELGRALHRAVRTGRAVSVLLIDLNGFKQVNDTLGHRAGDGLLTAVADAMRRVVREGDLIGRLGGDEFAIMLPGIDEVAAASVAQRITEAIAGPFVVDDVPMSATASIGVARSEPGELSVDALLHRADVAMYDRKRREAAPAAGAIRAVVAAAARDRSGPVVVPVTDRQLRSPRFAGEVAEALSASGLDPQELVLDVPDTPPSLHEVRALGVRLAVHDLAVAHASRDRVPIDFLRLPWLDGEPDGPVAEATARLGQSLGLTLLAGSNVSRNASSSDRPVTGST